MLLRHLPQEAWTQTALRDQKFAELVDPNEVQASEKFGPWRLDNYQLAALTDAVNRNTYIAAVAGRLKDPKVPEPTARPGLNRNVRQQSDAAVLYLDRLRAKG